MYQFLTPLVPPTVPIRIRRDALVADDETKEQMRKAIENTALAAMGVMKVKKKADLYSRKVLDKKDTEISAPSTSTGTYSIPSQSFTFTCSSI